MDAATNDTFGQSEPPDDQQEALERIRYMMGLLPGGSPFGDAVAIQPPDVRPMRVIDVRQVQWNAARERVDTRYAMLEQYLAVAKLAGVPVGERFAKAVAGLLDDVLMLQDMMRTVG